MKVKVITGATASGKTKFALDLVRNLHEKGKKAIIINADSSQIYKNFEVLTAQPSDAEKSICPHLLFGFLDVNEGYSVAAWLAGVGQILEAPEWEGYEKIIVGGTCMYIFTLINGLSELPVLREDVRLEALQAYEELGAEALLAKVREFEPSPPTDKHRLLRNYAYILQEGRALGELQKAPKRHIIAPCELELIKINPPREQIYAACNARFAAMLEGGAIEEVEAALGRYGDNFETSKIIGFSEIKGLIQGKMTPEECFLTASRLTRNLAKRQITWVRNKL